MSVYVYATATGVYATDGTVAGTTLLQAAGADFVPQPGTQMVALPNGKVLFFALVNPSLDLIGALTAGIRIWETDGTAAGTTLVADVAAPDGLEIPGDTISNVVAIGDNVSFSFNVPGSGSLLYDTNGTTAGTTVEQSATLPQTGMPSTSAMVGGSFAPMLIFATSAGVYATDGTVAGTTLLQSAGADFVPQPGTQMVTLPNGKVLFFALVNPSLDLIGALTAGIRIWETDGTAAGTTLVADVAAPDGLEIPGDTISNVVAIGYNVSFSFNVPGAGSLLYFTDGTLAGTATESSATLPQTGMPSTSAMVGGSFAQKLIFATSAGVYSTDGTVAGTTLLQAAGADFVPQPGTQMVALPNGKVLFFALVNPSLDLIGALTAGIRIWETDGTAAGTTLVADVPAPDGLETPGDTISNVVAIGDNVSFAFNLPGNGSLLYVTNGTLAGTAIEQSATLPQTGLTHGADTLCFCAGTLIATPDGDVPVEQLETGDRVLNLRGETRYVVWIGVGRVLATRGRRNAATPAILRKGALADNVPHHDLRVTKGHSFYIDGVLIPVEFLVNHRTILWDDRAQEVQVYHIELETHDVLLANGAPAESYRDDGNRWLFQNANSGWSLPPQIPCAPVLTGGPVVDAVWHRLLARSGRRSALPLTGDPDLHFLVDDIRLDTAERRNGVYVFNLLSTRAAVRIVSRAAAPQELGLARDPRSLGIALRRVIVRQGTRFQTFSASDPLLAEGFHAFEADNGLRWTDGDALIPPAMFVGFNGSCEVVLHLGGTTQYLADSAALRVA